jgi:hypothetical protein
MTKEQGDDEPTLFLASRRDQIVCCSPTGKLKKVKKELHG